ncbi:ATP-binding cassette sub-family C member 4 [Hyalella azteca]|uniref:ATP-binding cassette sub-family C member 4 n=1 Tax=Hyalella azteca TaxID=294128 RepID=A0A979FG32_HYAAZ|nr:ATP-binding cassette sub-family C member 4 [Hyalella azteca]
MTAIEQQEVHFTKLSLEERWVLREARIAQPVLLGQLLRHLGGVQGYEEVWKGWAFGTGIILCSLLYLFTFYYHSFNVRNIGMKMRIASCGLIYRKSLRLSQSALANSTVGKIVNLLSNDVQRFDTALIFFDYLWIAPLQQHSTLHEQRCFMGKYMTTLGYMGRVFARLRQMIAQHTDDRVSIQNVIINAIKVIKMFAWEHRFISLVSEARKKEIGVIRSSNLLKAVNEALFFSSAKLAICLTVITYVLTGSLVTAEKDFFAQAEIQTSQKNLSENFPRMSNKHGAEIRGLTALWNGGNRPTLCDITATVYAGELLVIVGPVGSGKSSLLHSLLGELTELHGSVDVSGKIAYAAQEPWLFSDSVRQNILFGEKYNPQKYAEILRVCGLDADLKQLADGDLTFVGERGTTLSGGQKARISLARALYQDGDVVLLDDPLSAVDAAVGKQLFDLCIRGYLRRKAVILVTHQLQYISAAHNILVLQYISAAHNILVLLEGKCAFFGTYKQLRNSNIGIEMMLDADDQSTPLSHAPSTVSSFLPPVNCLKKGLSNASQYGSVTSPGSTDKTKWNVSRKGSRKFSESYQGRRQSFVEALRVIPRPEEQRAGGSVSSAVYLQYFLRGGSWACILLLISLNIVTQLAFSGSDFWLALWTNKIQEETSRDKMKVLNVANETGESLENVDTFTSMNFVNIYGALVGGVLILSLGRTVLFFMMCCVSSRRLHDNMFQAVMRAPMRYFDTHPIGEVLNCFSKDMGQIDDLLPMCLWDFLTISLNTVGIIAMIAFINPYMLIPTVVLSVVLSFLRLLYLRSARDIKRLEAITRSPVFTHLGTSLDGLTTIRASRTQRSFIKGFDDIQDLHTSSWSTSAATTQWYGLALDGLSSFFVACVIITCLADQSHRSGDVGLAIYCALMLTNTLQWGVRQSAEVENQMTSVERVMALSELQPEASLIMDEDQNIQPGWPSTGEIEFRNVSLRYEEQQPLVLKNVSFHITQGEKIGIVGRTGAGKSSLMSCLLRLTEPTGQINIDGVDIGKLGLHTLRKNISIIPQDPVLFNGSLRMNLDPFNKHADEQLWNALHDVQMKEAVRASPDGLDHTVEEGGSNLSAGQRQLVCLARAILSHNRILLIDEATANVDSMADELIQRTIREKFEQCTVLTVAHRLHTVMDSTRVMVLSDGEVKELDAPHSLLQDRASLFSRLVCQADDATAERLHNIAREAYNKRNIFTTHF